MPTKKTSTSEQVSARRETLANTALFPVFLHFVPALLIGLGAGYLAEAKTLGFVESFGIVVAWLGGDKTNGFDLSFALNAMIFIAAVCIGLAFSGSGMEFESLPAKNQNLISTIWLSSMLLAGTVSTVAIFSMLYGLSNGRALFVTASAWLVMLVALLVRTERSSADRLERLAIRWKHLVAAAKENELSVSVSAPTQSLIFVPSVGPQRVKGAKRWLWATAIALGILPFFGMLLDYRGAAPHKDAILYAFLSLCGVALMAFGQRVRMIFPLKSVEPLIVAILLAVFGSLLIGLSAVATYLAKANFFTMSLVRVVLSSIPLYWLPSSKVRCLRFRTTLHLDGMTEQLKMAHNALIKTQAEFDKDQADFLVEKKDNHVQPLIRFELFSPRKRSKE